MSVACMEAPRDDRPDARRGKLYKLPRPQDGIVAGMGNGLAAIITEWLD